MIEFKIHTDGGDPISCDSCNCEVPTHPFDWGPPFHEKHVRDKRYLCDFCASSFAGNYTSRRLYDSRDVGIWVRKELAVLVAQAVNHIKDKLKLHGDGQ